MDGGIDAWVTKNFDPRGRFIKATHLPESDYRKFELAYDKEFRRVMAIVRL